MDLENIINTIQTERINDSDAALKNIASTEKYLEQSYQGRYLFELIQNVRDANKKANLTGSVFIELDGDQLIISNTGFPFDEPGVRSITTNGDSPKDSTEFIGFKGIGFKSVSEVSDRPEIVTQWGTIYFNKSETKNLLTGRVFKDREIPLFFIPHFKADKLSVAELEQAIVTKIVLPLNQKIDVAVIEKAFIEIGVHQILLLGNLEIISLKTINNNYHYNISEKTKSGIFEITLNNENYHFKQFKPSGKTRIPDAILETLEDKEKEIYSKDPFIDITLVFDLDKQYNLIRKPGSKLFLFLPTQITSGFNFIIHSYFLVNPERKNLRESKLNIFLLEQIGEYISGEWLKVAKVQHTNTFLEFLSFKRNGESEILKHLYDSVVKELESKKFIYDKVSKRFFNYKDIFIADGFDKGLFPDNNLNGKTIVYIEKPEVRNWLIDEFTVDYLEWSTIADNIEAECLKQKKAKNISFFENLYRYQIAHSDLDLKGKKVLLNSKWRLCSSDEYVIYGYKEKINLPSSIQNYIHFAHPDITITGLGRENTGFVEFNTDLLVRRILKLYDEQKVPKTDILIALLSLTISSRVIADVKLHILVPVMGKNKWINPLLQCVYLPTSELLQIYDESKFVDLTALAPLKLSSEELDEKLISIGVWDIPGIYYSVKAQTIRDSDARYQYIYQHIRSYSTSWFEIQNDWFFDAPLRYNLWSTNEIIKNWDRYLRTIGDDIVPVMKFKSQTSDLHDVHKSHLVSLSAFVSYLRTSAWVVLENNEIPFAIKNLVGIDPIESLETTAALTKKFLNVIPIHYESKARLIALLKLKHIDSSEISSFKEIFSWIHKTYLSSIQNEKEFVLFFNKMINKLFDFYAYKLKDPSQVLLLKETYFLGFDEIQNKYRWEKSAKIYYIEDKPAYDILPREIKVIIQPHFTLRDKNRFGQIAKRIGLDFRKTIIQRLQDIEIIDRYKLWDWLPHFYESMVLIEDQLEGNFDNLITTFKKAEVIVCKSINIDLIKDGIKVSTLYNVSHKIDSDQNLKVYVNQVKATSDIELLASIVHDFMVNLLGRELHKIRILLKDFYKQNDITAFLNNHEISYERIEELKQKIGGRAFSKAQIFWSNILTLKGLSNLANYFIDDGIEYTNIKRDLKIDNDIDLSAVSGSVNYENLSEITNINGLTDIFKVCNCELVDYNKIAIYKIDFTNYYIRVFEGLKIRYKNLVEAGLYSDLSKKDVDNQRQFQNLLDEYTMLNLEVNSPVLFLDVESALRRIISQKYKFIDFKESEVPKSNLNLKYKKNEATLFELIEKEKKYALNDFLLLNKNRSLLYFDNTIDKFLSLFSEYIKDNLPPVNNPAGQYDLSAYSNPTGLVVENVETNNTTINNDKGNKKGPSGRRINGGRSGDNTELIGIVGEKSVYEELLKTYSNVEWVSLNAKKGGHFPEGSDEHNCDIKFVDENNEVHYVEVKSKSNDEKHFFISNEEYAAAMRHKKNYHLYLVLFTLENNKRRILHLGNIFLLDNNSTLFKNKKFTAEFKQLEITFI